MAHLVYACSDIAEHNSDPDRPDLRREVAEDDQGQVSCGWCRLTLAGEDADQYEIVWSPIWQNSYTIQRKERT